MGAKHLKILENLAFNSVTKKGLNFPAVRHPNQQPKSMGSTQHLIKKKKNQQSLRGPLRNYSYRERTSLLNPAAIHSFVRQPLRSHA